MSGLIALANPRRIKAAHRRRRKCASGQSVQRYYDPSIGAFISVDPVAVRPTGDNFCRYCYGRNNPYRFTDPDGREAGGGYATGLYTQSGPITNSPEVAQQGLTAMAVVYGGAIFGGLRAVAANYLRRETTTALKDSVSPQQRGRDSEKRVLDDMGHTKNTTAAETSKGRTIPDFQTGKQVGEIKDTIRVSDTKQLQAQREYAQATGREHVVVTGNNTNVARTVESRGSTIIRREDLGPIR